MKWTIKYCLICISLLGIFSTSCYSKEAIFHYPDSLLNNGNWKDARIEYEKILFLHNSREVQTYALLQKANCYKQEHDFEKASKTINRIYTFGLPDSTLFNIKYEKAFIYYLNKEAGKAIVELQALQTKLWEKEALARLHFLTSINYLELKEWESSRIAAENFIQTIVPDKALNANYFIQLEHLFSEKNIPKQLSAKKAKNLSRIFPGSGQFYAGKIGEGLVSFTLHASLLYFGASQFYHKFYFTGYTAGFGLLHRIHTGNLQRVQDLVAEVNEEKNDQFYQQLFNILSDIAINADKMD